MESIIGGSSVDMRMKLQWVGSGNVNKQIQLLSMIRELSCGSCLTSRT